MFDTFDSWADVLAFAHLEGVIWYHAPLDVYPVMVLVVKVFKNGKLRLRASDLTFTADASHLSRMRKRS